MSKTEILSRKWEKMDKDDLDDLVQIAGRKMGLKDWNYLGKNNLVVDSVRRFEKAVEVAVKRWILENPSAFVDNGKWEGMDVEFGWNKKNLLMLLLGYENNTIDILWGIHFTGDKKIWEKKFKRYLEDNLSGFVDDVEDALTDAAMMGSESMVAKEEIKMSKTASELMKIAKSLISEEDVVFHASSRGGRWEVIGYSDGSYKELKHGQQQGGGGRYSRNGLSHRLAAIIQDSKVIDGINYLIDMDKIGVKELLSQIDSTKPAPVEFLRMSKEVAMSLVANKQKYKGYTIEKSGANFYVTDPSGHRAFEEVPASIEIAKKWIDLDIREKGTKVAFREEHGGEQVVASELVKIAKSLIAEDEEAFKGYSILLDYVAKKHIPILTAQDIHRDVPTIHNFAKKYHNSVEHKGYGCFVGKTEHGEFLFDGGGAMNHDGNISWTTLQADDNVLRDLGYDMRKVERALTELVEKAGPKVASDKTAGASFRVDAWKNGMPEISVHNQWFTVNKEGEELGRLTKVPELKGWVVTKIVPNRYIIVTSPDGEEHDIAVGFRQDID